MPIGFPFNPGQCAFISSAALNSNQFDPNVLDTDNLTPHNLLWNFVENKLQWVDTKTNIIVQELGGGGGPLPIDNKNIILVDQVFGNDATAVAYDMFKPFQTVDAAMAASVSGDLVFMNPAPFPYNAFNNIFDTVQGINFYLSKGAVFNVFFATIDSGAQDISIIGEGDVNFFTSPGLGNFAGNFTLQCNNFLLNGAFLTTGSFSGDINITVNRATLNSFFFLNNSGYWPIQTKATNFNFAANNVVNNSIIFVFYPATVQINIDVKNYNSVIGVGAADIWCEGNGAPTYPVISYIHFDSAIRDSSFSGYADHIFRFNFCTPNNVIFITGNYNYTGNGLGGQAPAIIATSLRKGMIFFDGVANITKGSMLLELNCDAASKVRIAGKVYVDNSGVGFQEYLFSVYIASQAILEIVADTIINSPNNYGMLIGDYSSSAPTAQVDVIDCEIVNTSVASAFPTIIKGINAFTNSPTQLFWGKLRLQNAKILNANPVTPTITGGNVHAILTYTVTLGVQFTLGETVTNGLGASGQVITINSPTSITLEQSSVANFGIGNTITGGSSLTVATVNVVAYQYEPVDVYTAYANTPQVSIANTIAGTVIITDPAVTSNDF